MYFPADPLDKPGRFGYNRRRTVRGYGRSAEKAQSLRSIMSEGKAEKAMAKKDGLLPEENTPAEENEEYDPVIYTLTDEDGKEYHFALLESLEDQGNEYKALIPVNEDGEEESNEYIILKCAVDENGEEILETIDDDDEFDRIADMFDDEFSDIFYDED